VTFHPLCARNAGCYLAIRQSAGKAVYRCYCLNHSESQRRKDLFGTEVRAAYGPHTCMICEVREAPSPRLEDRLSSHRPVNCCSPSAACRVVVCASMPYTIHGAWISPAICRAAGLK